MAAEASEKGRHSYNFIPLVSTTVRCQLDDCLVQFLTENGNFNAKLCKFKPKDNGACECGLEETAEHVLCFCVLHKDLRDKYLATVDAM